MDGETLTEDLELWARNPIDCIQELLENPAASDANVYEPKRVWRDKERKTREYSEMWTGDWWWDTQVCVAYIARAL